MDLPRIIFIEGLPEEYEPKLLKMVKASGGVLYEVTESGCWVVTSHRFDGVGHARIGRNGKYYSLALIAWTQRHKELPVPEGHRVYQHCGNKGCVNPDHLMTGTPTEVRMQARISKSPNELTTIPLTARDKELICRLARQGVPRRAIVYSFCITDMDLTDIVKAGRRLASES